VANAINSKRRVWVDENAPLSLADVTIGGWTSSVWRFSPPFVATCTYHYWRSHQAFKTTSLFTYHSRQHLQAGRLTLCRIGDDVTVGHMQMLHGCTVRSRVLVGMGTTILDGAVIEERNSLSVQVSLVPPGKTFRNLVLCTWGPPVKKNSSVNRKRNRILFKYAGLNYVNAERMNTCRSRTFALRRRLKS